MLGKLKKKRLLSDPAISCMASDRGYPGRWYFKKNIRMAKFRGVLGLFLEKH